MENIEQNKLAVAPIKKLIWKLGLPMIISMVLQALYNVIDSAFVANMEGSGAIANEALTYAFPIQILMIAIGVGTGVGINALLSKSLGEKNKEKVNIIAGNGIFISLIIFIFFLIFELFLSKWFISLFTSDKEVIQMGTSYLAICCSLSFGSIGFTIYERFLQATGNTLLSTIAQISGAVINIVFDYIFIYPLNMGVEGAALATVLGQFVSLIITILFEIIARPLAKLFALSNTSSLELIDVCEKAIRIASFGYIFMGFSVASQGVFQALRYSLKPLFTALLRLVIFVFPIAYLFTLSTNVMEIVWWTFPIAELLTAVISIILLKKVIKKCINVMEN